MQKLSYVQETAVSASYGCTEFAQSGNAGRPYLNVKAYGGALFDWMNIEVAEGRLPANSHEMVISKSAVDDGAKISIGDLIQAEYFERSVTGIDQNLEATIFPFHNLKLAYGETKEVPEYFPYYGENESFRENRNYTGQTGTYEIVGIIETPSYESTGAAGYTALTMLNGETGLTVWPEGNDGNRSKSASDNRQEGVPKQFNITMLLDLGNLQASEYYTELWEIAGEREIDFNDYVLSFSANSSDSVINMVVVYLSVFFVTLILVTSIILIYNVFNMSFQERSRYLGMLCSVGATGRQKRSSIYYESFCMLVAAVPFGILGGIGIIWFSMTKLRPLIGNFMQIYEIVEGCPVSVIISPMNIAAVIISSALTVLVSSWFPARKIGTVGPIECMRGNVEKKSRRYGMSIITLRRLGAEGMLAKNMLTRRGQKTRSVMLATAVFLILMAVTGFGSVAIHKVIDEKMMGSSLNTNEAMYDYVLLGNYFDDEFEAVREEILSDPGVAEARLWADGMFTGVVSQEAYSQEYWDSMHDIYNLYYHRELTEEEFEEYCPHESNIVNIMAVDDETMMELGQIAGADADILTDKDRPAVIMLDEGELSTDNNRVWGMEPEHYRYYHMDRITDMSVGDRLPLRFYSPEQEQLVDLPAEIAGFVKKEQIGDYITRIDMSYMWIFVDEAYCRKILELTRDEDGRTAMDPMLFIRMNGTNTDLIDRLLAVTGQEESNMILVSSGYMRTITDAILDIADVLLICFVALASAICLLNLFNSVRGWISESRKEFAMLKSVGMTRKQIQKMLLLECAGIILKSLLLAGIVSGILIYVVKTGLVHIFGNLVLPLPALPLAATVLLTGTIIAGLSLYCFGRENRDVVMECIRMENLN